MLFSAMDRLREDVKDPAQPAKRTPVLIKACAYSNGMASAATVA